MKTKIFTLLLALAASVGTMLASTKIGDLYYDLNSTNRTAVVTYKSYSSSDYNSGWRIKNVNIPASVIYGDVEYSVISIGNYAFCNCSYLTTVTIPKSIKSIGLQAFYGCTSLNSVHINDIASWCATSFIYFNNNTYYDGSNPLTYADNLYLNDTLIVELVLPDSITSVGSHAFHGCTGINSVTIPNSVTSIGGYAFYHCTGLNSVTIPNSVTSIGEHSFYSCSGLTSVKIGNGVASIGNSAFSGCSGLTSVTIGNSVTSIGDYAFNGCSGLTFVIIGNSVTSIGERAFQNCNGLTSVTISNSVTRIGVRAFALCNRLSSITIPNSVTSIGSSAFYNCSSLTSVTVNTSAIVSKVYSSSSLRDIFGNQVTEYIIGDGVTSIGEHAFNDCSSLTSVTIPNSVNSIGSGAFRYCSSLTSVTIPNGVTSIGDYAFNDCSSLTSITIEAAIPPTQGYNVFKETNSFDIYVPCGTIDIYKSSWSSYASKFKYRSYTITTNSQNGSVSTEPEELTICSDKTLTATPDYGYHFVKWSDDNRDNPRTIALTQDTIFTAEFAKNTYSISTESANPEFGTTEGDKTALYLDEVEISASANYGYHFTQWSDGNTDNPRTIILTQDTSFSATFSKNMYFITVNATNGTISGSLTAEYLDEVSLTVTPDYGFHFTQWSDGNTENPRTLILTSDTTFTAEFAPNKYNVSIIYDQEKGAIEGESGEFDYLTRLTYRAVAKYGYHLDHWNVIKEYILDNTQLEDSENNLLWDYSKSAPQDNPDRGLYYASKVNDSNLKGIKLNSSGYCSFTKNAVAGILKLTFGPRYSGGCSLRVENRDGESVSLITTTEDVYTLNTVSIPLTEKQNDIYIKRSAENETVLQKIQFIETLKTYAREDTVSIVVVGDTAIQAFFAKNSYQIIDNTKTQEGYISGAGYYSYYDTVRLTAIPHSGYHFTQWSDGIKENPREVILTQDSTFVAQFEIVNSGTCGEDNQLTWTYDDETKTLTISGSEALTSNFTYGVEAPIQMQNLIIGNEVTAIGDSAFYGMSTINHLVIGGSVASIGDYAFAECKNFDDITCYATTVPTITENTFANVGNKQYIYLYVPEGRQRAYLRDTYWGEFDIQVKNAEAVTEPTEDVVVTPSENSVEIVWPIVTGAETYEITITKDNQIVCTLTFNAQGLLAGIAFAPARGMTKQQQAEGFRFTITGLTSNTQYGYSVVSKDASNNSLDTKSGSFTTTGIATDIDDISSSLQGGDRGRLILHNGQIFILRGEKVYTITGQEVR